MSEKPSLKIKEGSYKVTIQGSLVGMKDYTTDVVYKKGKPEDAKILSINITERDDKCLKR